MPLFIVATPIGNLKDISQRAIETLRNSHSIFCEDQRRAKILLNQYDIHVPTLSYHRFSEKKSLEEALSRLERGENLSLISDAGTPLISDPGLHLVQLCRDHRIEMTVIPGASAPIAALALSGFDGSLFQFCGFLPKKEGELLERLTSLLFYEGTSIAFVSPHSLMKSLHALATLAPTRRLFLARELTKCFEELIWGDGATLSQTLSERKPLGEYTLVIEGLREREGQKEPTNQWRVELLELRTRYGLTLKEGIKAISLLHRLSTPDLYRLFFQEEELE